MDYRLEGLPRPPPLVPGLPQPTVEELEAGLAAAALAETREKLAAFLQETEQTGVGAWLWRLMFKEVFWCRLVAATACSRRGLCMLPCTCVHILVAPVPPPPHPT